MTIQASTADRPYPRDLYSYSRIAEPVVGLDRITSEEAQRFHREGFLAVENAFSPEEIASALASLYDLLDGRHPGFKGVQYEAMAHETASSLPTLQKQDAVRKFWQFIQYDERLAAMANHPPLLAVLNRIMGDTPQLFQDMALLKPPRIGGEKPWHQDCAYFKLPVETCIVGVWIALDPATTENGCMQVIPGSHREGPKVHFQRRDWQVCDSEVPVSRAVAVPLRPGGCLFFHGLLMHGTPENQSPLRRRAIQFHYKPAGAPWIGDDERLAVFGSEGKDVEC